jgi:DNA-directed RNA polymerase subunit M/transcription elongation factor TFIIS
MKVEKRLFVNGGKRCKEKICVRVCRLCLSILEVRENIWVKTRKVILPLTFRKDIFVETAFEKRFQQMLHSAWDNRSWHLIVADPGAGKTMGIRDLLKTAGGRSVLAVVAPKNNEDEQALGDQFFTALGIPLRGHWRTRKPKLMGHLHQYGTECLIVDDAHDLSLEHLMLLKEVTDQGRLQYDHPLGLCLVAAGRGDTIPLKETFDLPDPTWLQFRRRFDKLAPFCRVASHTSEEVRDILATLEQEYRPILPQLNLRQWTSSIYTWLTHPVLDPTHSGRVTMDNLMKLVTTALEWSYLAGEAEVRAARLKSAAELLVLRHDTLKLIDGAGPDAGSQDQNKAQPASVNGKEPERQTVPEKEQQNTTKTVETVETAKEQEQTSTLPKCTFSRMVVPIDLKRFADSGVTLVECPNCGRTRSLSPVKGVLRFKPHEPRKIQTKVSGLRWSAKGKTDWDIVGGE